MNISTKVNHKLLNKLDISIDAYCIADAIYNEQIKHDNICKVDIEEFVKTFDLSRATIYNILKELENKDILKKLSRGVYQITDKWINTLSVLYINGDTALIDEDSFEWVGEKPQAKIEKYAFRANATPKHATFYFGDEIKKHLKIKQGSRIDVGFDKVGKRVAFKVVSDGGYTVQETYSKKYLSVSVAKSKYPFEPHNFIEMENIEDININRERMVIVSFPYGILKPVI
jgi:DNA-binding PadR family transcriptional regulator